jgi:NADH dehydrogenase [ubiquinone] 1 alpha subcomplex assembly factor 7
VTALAALLRRKIVEEGPLSVAEYISCALNHPQHGYYTTRDPFGVCGDFVTAPEISQVFGELIAAWCVEVWRTMGAPARVLFVELGPGRGTLAADAWRCWRKIAPDFADAMRPHLVETSPELRMRQRAALERAGLPDAAWHTALTEVPEAPAVLVANEFFDALPIRQYVRRRDGWRERLVGLSPEGEGFVFIDGSLVDHPVVENGDFAAMQDQLEAATEGDILELCPAADALATEIATRMAGQGGAALIIDYGPANSALGDTLQAVGGHRHADPLADPGEVDLSHHVDFGRLRAAAHRVGARPCGPIPQGLFLGRLGIVARARALAETAPTPQHAHALRSAVRRLVHPGRMGLLFKALAIADPKLPVPPGFSP